MKCILMNDICVIYNKYIKYMCVYLILIFIYLLTNYFIGNELDIQIILSALGLNCTFKSRLLPLIMYIFNIGVILFIPLVLLTNDLDYGMDNLFLRLNIKKWLLFKTISILTITLIFKLIIYLLVIIICISTKINFFNILSNFKIDIIFSILLQLIFLVSYLIMRNHKKILPIIIVLSILNFKYLVIDIVNINNYYIIYFLIIINFIILSAISKKKYIFL